MEIPNYVAENMFISNTVKGVEKKGIANQGPPAHIVACFDPTCYSNEAARIILHGAA
jgi:hypothetical protein